MIKLVIKNIKEVELPYRQQVEEIITEKYNFFKNLFKKYDKDLTVEVIFNRSSITYTVSASIDLKSKKVLVAEENRDPIRAVTKLMNEFKKAVKRQYELERKDYEYKRKNRRK